MKIGTVRSTQVPKTCKDLFYCIYQYIDLVKAARKKKKTSRNTFFFCKKKAWCAHISPEEKKEHVSREEKERNIVPSRTKHKAKTWLTRWWFQILFIFIPTWGDDPIWSNLTDIFQMGWNHRLVDALTGKWVTVMCHSQMASVTRTLRGPDGSQQMPNSWSSFPKKETRWWFSHIVECSSQKNRGRWTHSWRAYFSRWVVSSTHQAVVFGEILESGSRQVLNGLNPKRTAAGFRTWMSNRTEVDGSMVKLGSVGDVTPILYTPFRSRW